MLSLITLPNPILRKVAEDVKFPVDSNFRKFIKEMFTAMKHYDGIGLAAPQVGKSIQLMVINTPNKPTAFINPVVLKKSWKKSEAEEGCLSVPNVYGMVKRSKKILVSFFNIDGVKHEEWLDGMIARVYQHEVDHLNGILFIDRTKKIIQGKELLAEYLTK
jgi:peptide deformylase